jgi:hypothetical protein
MDKSAYGYIVEMFMSICQVLQEHLDTYDAHKSTRHTLNFSLLDSKLIIVKRLITNQDT